MELCSVQGRTETGGRQEFGREEEALASTNLSATQVHEALLRYTAAFFFLWGL